MREIIKRLIKFRDDRDWLKFHTSPELARAISIEASELNELFLWGKTAPLERVKEEVADVMIFCINLCIVVGLDPIKIINDKIDLNAIKYPVGGSRD